MRDLLTLYKLLWEQIKDNENLYDLLIELDEIWDSIPMKSDEYYALEKDLLKNSVMDFNEVEAKEFVQRRIKELENKE